MSWVATAVIGTAAVAGGTGAVLGAKAGNKKLKGADAPFSPYSGLRPPRVDYTDAGGTQHLNLRPVQQQITDIAMRRSLGQDVGFDPKRREELINMYDLTHDRMNKESNQSASDRLSGMGLSGNLRAYDEILRRQMRDQADRRSQYEMGVDVEDLAKRNEERDVNTARLQDLNTTNFGQENTAANFDENVWAQEQGLEGQRRQLQLGVADRYKDMAGEGIMGGLYGAQAGANIMSGGMGSPTMSKSSSTPIPSDFRLQDYYGNNQKYRTPTAADLAIMKAQNQGFNFSSN